MRSIPKHLMESVENLIDTRYVISAIVIGVTGYFIRKWEKAENQNRPILEELRDSLNKDALKTEIRDFANKETIYDNIIVRPSKGKISLRSMDGKSLSCLEISRVHENINNLSKSSSFINLPKLVKERVDTFKNSLNKFCISVNNFNKHYPSNSYIEISEQECRPKILNGLNEIEQNASLLEKQRAELQCIVNDKLEWKWWIPW